MNEQIRELSKKLPFDLGIEAAIKSNEEYMSCMGSRQERLESLDKKIITLEKKLAKAKNLKNQIEIIQIKKYISMKEVQIYINRSRSWIYTEMETNNFPGNSKKSGKEHLFLREAVDRWVDEHLFNN